MKHSFHHRGPMRYSQVKGALPFKTKSDVWTYVDEYITACGSETYPWDEQIVKAVRRYEPDFCPLWVVTVYQSPAGSLHKFGRHAIGIDTKNHIQEGKHQPLKVLTSFRGVNAGRRPIVVSDILQDKSVSLIPDLKVYGYMPFDWNVYYAAKKSVWERRHTEEKNPEDEIMSLKANHEERERKHLDAVDAEADYRFDHVTNRGKTFREQAQSLTHADWRAMGVK